MFHRSFQIPLVKSLAGRPLARVVQLGVGGAEQQFKYAGIVPADEGAPQKVIIAPAAEPLLAEIVGHAVLAQMLNQGGQFHHVGRVYLADFDGEAIGL